MAMTKKEQAAMQAAIDRAETLAALRWTAPVPTDVPIPEPFGSYSEGWCYNTYNKTVWLGWSTSVSHGDGPAPKGLRYKIGSQRGIRMHSTKALALASLRHELENQFATDLLKIDRQIAELKAKEDADA